MKQCFIVLMLSAALFAPHIVSAQDDLPRVRFSYSPPSLLDDRDFIYNLWFGSTEVAAVPDYTTMYYVVPAGGQTIEFTVSDEDDSSFSTEISLEAGNRYTVIGVGADQSVIVVNETVAESELAEGENTLTIVTPLAAGNGTTTGAFKVLDNLSPTPRERAVFEYSGYLQSGIGENGVVIQRLDPKTQAVISSVNIPYFANTNVLINGDRLNDTATPLVINYSTSLSTSDWLEGINQMANPPFTFNEFINSAVVGGFDAALAECADYMWFPWTDGAFAQQSSDNQSFISGAGAGEILNDSVHEGASTTPWLMSPTNTRGGTALFFGSPLAELDSPTAGSLSGNILMTISTTGNGVQNVIHITDAVPTGETAQTPVEDLTLYPSRTTLNLVLPLGSGS